jgi:hypothetical protein
VAAEALKSDDDDVGVSLVKYIDADVVVPDAGVPILNDGGRRSVIVFSFLKEGGRNNARGSFSL